MVIDAKIKIRDSIFWDLEVIVSKVGFEVGLVVGVGIGAGVVHVISCGLVLQVFGGMLVKENTAN